MAGQKQDDQECFSLVRLFYDWIILVSVKYSLLNKTAGEKARRQLLKNAASNMEQVLEATPHKAPAIHPSRKLSKLDQPDMQDTAGEAGTSS